MDLAAEQATINQHFQTPKITVRYIGREWSWLSKAAYERFKRANYDGKKVEFLTASPPAIAGERDAATSRIYR